MNEGKDDVSVVKFMALFHRLRELIDGNPDGLDEIADGDDSVSSLCFDLNLAASFLSRTEDSTGNFLLRPLMQISKTHGVNMKKDIRY